MARLYLTNCSRKISPLSPPISEPRPIKHPAEKAAQRKMGLRARLAAGEGDNRWNEIKKEEQGCQSGGCFSLELRVLRLGLLQDRDVGIGIFPEGEEFLVGGAALGGIA